MFRLPLRLYAVGLGWLLGHTFMLMTHVGRSSGEPHDMVAMVLDWDPDTREVVICSGWGPDADWVRNLRARPARLVRIGRTSFIPRHRFLSDEEAFSVGVAFRRRHPWRMRFISRVLGWGDLRRDEAVREFVHTHPFVALRPDDHERS